MMKRKHWAALAFIMAVMPLGVTGLNGFRLIQNPGYTHASAQTTIRPLEMPGPGVVREIAQLTREINTINTGLASDTTHVDLKLFGYESLEDPKQSYRWDSSTGGDNPDLPQLEYAVSLAFDSDTKGFCVIDGRFFPEGGTLPDGAKVMKVEAQRVLIEKFNLKRWIPVTEPVRMKLSEQR